MRHAYTLQQYLDTWGRDVRPFFRPLFYDDLAFGADLKPGTYIFADLERLDDAAMELARLTWSRLAARPADYRLLNDPSKVLLRYDLLKAVHAAGINRFAAHRMNNGSLPKRFPVFLRPRQRARRRAVGADSFRRRTRPRHRRPRRPRRAARRPARRRVLRNRR